MATIWKRQHGKRHFFCCLGKLNGALWYKYYTNTNRQPIGRRQWFDQRFRPTICCVVTQTVPVFVTFLLQMELGVRFLCQGVWGCLQIASRLFGPPYLQLIVRRPLLFVTETWRPSPSHQRSEESLRCYTMLNGHRWNCCWWRVNRWHVERWRWKVERWPPSKRTGRQRRRTACKTRTPQKCTK